MHLGLSYLSRQAFIFFILHFTHASINLIVFYCMIKVYIL